MLTKQASEIRPNLVRDLDFLLASSEFKEAHKDEALKRFDHKTEKAKDAREVAEKARAKEDEKKRAHTAKAQQRVHWKHRVRYCLLLGCR